MLHVPNGPWVRFDSCPLPGLHRAALLRLAARQAHRARPHARGGGAQDALGARASSPSRASSNNSELQLDILNNPEFLSGRLPHRPDGTPLCHSYLLSSARRAATPSRATSPRSPSRSPSAACTRSARDAKRVVDVEEITANLDVCPHCGHHMRLSRAPPHRADRATRAASGSGTPTSRRPTSCNFPHYAEKLGGGARKERRGRRRGVRPRDGRGDAVRPVRHERRLHDGLHGRGRGREDRPLLRARRPARACPWWASP